MLIQGYKDPAALGSSLPFDPSTCSRFRTRSSPFEGAQGKMLKVKFQKGKRCGLTSQIRRSVVSIASNIDLNPWTPSPNEFEKNRRKRPKLIN
jgi:23S rRNA-intervening sequence protein